MRFFTAESTLKGGKPVAPASPRGRPIVADDFRDLIARSIHQKVLIHPTGHAHARLSNGQSIRMSGAEAEDAADAALVVRDAELETARATIAQLRTYAVHRRGCLFWVAQPCNCGLAALDSPKDATDD